MAQEEERMTLREALQLRCPSVYHVYFRDGGSPVSEADYEKYLDQTGHLEYYDDDDGADDDGRPIILHLLWFILDITDPEGGN